MKVRLCGTLFAITFGSCFALAEKSPANPVRFHVVIQELPPMLAPREGLIEANIVTAAKMWTDLVAAKPCDVTIAFGIRDVMEGDPQKLGYGKSARSAPFRRERQDGRPLAEQGLASLLRTGRHPKEGEPDVEIGFQTAYVLREFWWDPDPSARKAAVPPGKLDAVSVVLREPGHAIAFNLKTAVAHGDLA